MKISIIVVVYNGVEYLHNLVDSLSKSIWPHDDYEIIFVDNASGDNSLSILDGLEKNFSFELIKNENNLGFAGGNNIGIQKALSNQTDYVVLLNQDTVVEPDWLEELFKTMKVNSNIGAVQSLLLYWDSKDTVNSWGNLIHFLGFGYAGGNLEKVASNRNKIVDREITYASGAAVMLKSEVLKSVELLDSVLESYHEDLDLGLKLRIAGYKTYLSAKSVVYHKYNFLSSLSDGNKSEGGLSGQYKYYLMERNRILIILTYYSLRTILLMFPAWVVMEIGVLLFASIRGFWREKFKGYMWVIKSWGYVMIKRDEVQASKNISDKEMMRDFVSVINFQEINTPLLKYFGNPLIRFYWWVFKKLI